MSNFLLTVCRGGWGQPSSLGRSAEEVIDFEGPSGVSRYLTKCLNSTYDRLKDCKPGPLGSVLVADLKKWDHAQSPEVKAEAARLRNRLHELVSAHLPGAFETASYVRLGKPTPPSQH
jgi:hypothetical protein